jgi:hypothetical protein
MGWIKTSEKLPMAGQEIEMTCKHWESNWTGNFGDSYIDKGSFDEFGNFWDSEGARIHDPTYWRPYQPERSKREDDKQPNNFICGNCHSYKLSASVCRCGALNSMET